MRRTHAFGWALAATLVFAAGLACNNEKKNSDSDPNTSGASQDSPREGSSPRADF